VVILDALVIIGLVGVLGFLSKDGALTKRDRIFIAIFAGLGALAMLAWLSRF
jgi:hypothetical protein